MTARVGTRQVRLQRLLQEAEILARNGNLGEAERRYRSALRAHRGDPGVLSALAAVLAAQDRPQEAAQALRRALSAAPGDADLHYNLGVMLQRLDEHEGAIGSFRASLGLRPAGADALVNIGLSLHELGRYGEALDHYGRALALAPGLAEAYSNSGNALQALGRHEEALAQYREAIAADPRYAVAHDNLGNLLKALGRYREAIASYRAAVSAGSERAAAQDPRAFSNYLLALNYAEAPGAAEVAAEHRRFGALLSATPAEPAVDRRWPRRLRLAYVSPDFRGHSVARFIEPLLARHDRTRFEVTCYYTHRERDAVSDRLRALADHWVDCAQLTDAELDRRIRAQRIDLLVDLAGHTGGNRLPVFAGRPAPVQIAYLGYPNTWGLQSIDYRITDALADPPEETEPQFGEQLLRPWPTYYCYRAPEAPEAGPLPARAAGVVTFGCFNNLAKLSDGFLSAAAGVLQAVHGSRLILKSAGLEIRIAAEGLRDRLRAVGVDPMRVQLRGWERETRDHLAAYREIDIALDSFPYNGATTTCEALWMGVPVVTLLGDRHAGRMGASLLHALGLADLVARDATQYIETCARLAADLGSLEGLRAGLRARMRNSPLMDEAGFTRAVEAAYLEAWRRKLQTASS